MNLEELRSEFEVLVIEPVVDTAENYARLASVAGYQSSVCTDPVEAISIVRQKPPHIILFSSSDLDSSARQIEALASISSEFQILVLTNKTQSAKALSFVERAIAYDTINLPLNSPSELITKIDRAAEKILLLFQLEEAQLKHAESVYKNSKAPGEDSFPVAPLISLRETTPSQSTHHHFEDDILKLSMSRDPGQVLATFLQLVSDRLSSRSVAYFKFLPTHFSFVYAEGVGIHVPSQSNIGVDLRNSGFRDASEVFSQLEKIAPLNELFSRVFKAPKFSLLPHALDGEPLGFFAILGELSADEKERFRVLERLFSLVYQRNLLLRAKEQFEIRDSLTGLINVAHFENRLKEELSRSRRTGLAVSLVVFEIDRLMDIENQIGVSNADTILKMISVIVRKTSRSNDISGILSRGRFAVILPHTDVEGAKVRSERLRKMIGSTKFPMAESEGTANLTISAAICEYPSLASDTQTLVRSALNSLKQAQANGGNQWETAKVSADFQPDFIAHKVNSPTSFESNRGRTK